MAIGDIYQVTLNAVFQGQSLRNVWYYQATGGTDTSALDLDVAFNFLWFAGSGAGTLRSTFFSNTIQYRGYRVVNLFDEGDLRERVYSPILTGLGTSEPLASFIAATCRTPQVTRAIRRGFKRFGGLIEGGVLGNALTASALTSVQALAVSLGTVLGGSGGATGLYTPVIVKRIKELPQSGSAPIYRLPKTPAEAEFFPATTWEAVQAITTQRSRKFGAGE